MSRTIFFWGTILNAIVCVVCCCIPCHKAEMRAQKHWWARMTVHWRAECSRLDSMKVGRMETCSGWAPMAVHCSAEFWDLFSRKVVKKEQVLGWAWKTMHGKAEHWDSVLMMDDLRELGWCLVPGMAHQMVTLNGWLGSKEGSLSRWLVGLMVWCAGTTTW